MIQATLGFLIKENKILLTLKKRGFGEGKYNGFGGKLEEGESVESCIVREAREEIGIDLKVFKKVGVLQFHSPKQSMNVTVFLCPNWKGDPKEGEEVVPKWFETNKIPFDKMWDDDLHWLPMVLDGETVEGEFYFNDSGRLIKHDLRSKK